MHKKKHDMMQYYYTSNLPNGTQSIYIYGSILTNYNIKYSYMYLVVIKKE